MAITIKEIANLAGTSRGTVDRVFNNRGKVNKELADKILKIAKENDYTPNTMAKLLVASQKKCVIGVVLNAVGNVFFEEVLSGIRSAEDEWKNNVQLKVIQLKGYSDTNQVDAIETLIKSGINALVITPVDSQNVKNKLNEVALTNMPIAFVNSDLEDVDRMFAVGVNNRQNGCIAGNIASLFLKENSKIAVVTGSNINAGNRKRVLGFSEVISESGKNLEIVKIVENHDNNEYSKVMVTKLLDEIPDLDFIYFCAGGIRGGLLALEEAGSDVKVLTVDMGETIKRNMKEGRVIATITQDPFSQGYLPIEMLVKYFVFGKDPKKKKIHTENKIIVKYNL